MRKVFIKNLGKHIKERDLMRFFQKIGQIDKVEVLRDYKTKKSRRVAYVTFKTQEAAESVINSRETWIIKGKQVQCERCLLREEINLKKKVAFSDVSTQYSNNFSQEDNYQCMLFNQMMMASISQFQLNLRQQQSMQTQFPSFITDSIRYPEYCQNDLDPKSQRHSELKDNNKINHSVSQRSKAQTLKIKNLNAAYSRRKQSKTIVLRKKIKETTTF